MFSQFFDSKLPLALSVESWLPGVGYFPAAGRGDARVANLRRYQEL